MPDYYIRTPEQNESRGPFDISKLLTLAEAGQINPNTLYYDEDKEEWIPLSLNEELKMQVFPVREKLALRTKKSDTSEATQAAKSAKAAKAAADEFKVESMLAAADGDTVEKRKQTRQKKSSERSAEISVLGLGLMMVFSALFLILPLIPQIQGLLGDNDFAQIFNYPTVLFAVFDLIIGILLFLSVTEVFPLVRGRAMLTLGFGVYIGWAIGDPLVMGLMAASGIGIFWATLSQSLSTMILAFILGIGGNLFLAYLALNGRFDGFFDSIVLNLIPN